MGCQISKEEDEKKSDQQSNTEHNTTDTMAHRSTAATEYKSRLEWKLCLAKDTPEPEFDLSDCNLKEIPSGVFVLCRILLKERLNLQNNQLQSLNGGGILADLSNLTLINLSFNRFTRVPDEFCNMLKNLRELFLSHNVIDILPGAVNKLTNLELLDVSHNRLTRIDQIGFMPNLRILNITGNENLTQLPNQLTTCDSLMDIVLDPQYILYPPANVIECGTAEILKYLLEHNGFETKPAQNIKRTTAKMIEIERGRDVVREWNNTNDKHSISKNDKYTRDKKFMERERSELERYSNLEAELHQQQQKRKQNLLQHLLQQQNESDTMIQRMQKEKDSERHKLIEDILQAEANAGMIVDQLISLKSGPDSALLEQEQEEQKQLLEQLRINHDDLRKRDILAAMTELLEYETKQIEMYNEKRDNTSKTLLEHEINTNQLLDNLFKNNDKDRAVAVSKITQNEDLQKRAFTALIEKNDARTWGLIEQVRIVETQLASMTNCEIERKKLQMDDQIVDLSEQRVKLTYVLLDLLEQQSSRKRELLDTLMCLESQRENEHQDFWLLQYQKLLDSQPAGEQSFRSNSIDPLLGYNFLVNGVVHCIPFLSRLWQSDKCNIYDITENDLIEAGIKNACDREKILQSIRDFLKLESPIQTTEAIPQQQTIATDEQSAANDEQSTGQSTTEMESECVICMEESCKIIFLPCGHLCCCLNCHSTIENCPMCRAHIERRIKIIQA
ncbi:E3 ubiquitin-protein ligase LRSAM1-like [Contarinia nasturtii]|uniref:E3 ubiquitin-protein ligase LRSAM1-like n=1 Tax=Contarinia nasturtii TaxID=265458 RepID=UPI0012D48FD4|nr:E3 ubiquitin-protein ligase LRSAM1-like [Contarinia nasturtii]XP_031622110.1 E3 ubiquitin-protein ligase LRSAM1-like [Contarinia nasturtii]XP_031622111.1 E3 ubiquitin-protein ligase LRSAM1-like [Contarinia nasturtii]